MDVWAKIWFILSHMTHSPDHGTPHPAPTVDRGPAPDPIELRDAEREALADLEAARIEGKTPRISPAAQEVLDRARAAGVRTALDAYFAEQEAARAHAADKSHGAGGSHDAHAEHGHDAHGHDGHGHGKTPPKGGNAATAWGGWVKGGLFVGAVNLGAAVRDGFLWVVTAPHRWLLNFGKNNAPKFMQTEADKKSGGAKPAKKKDDHGHGGGHGGGHH